MRLTLAVAFVIACGPASAESGLVGVWTMSAEPGSSGGAGLVTALSPAQNAGYNDPAYLIARCITGQAELLVGTNGGWGVAGRRLDVSARIDDAPARSEKWDVSTNGKAVFLDEGVEAFMRAIPDDGTLRVAIRGGDGELHETAFRTTGFGTVRAKIAEACKWKP